MKRHLTLLVQVAGLFATGWMVWTAAVVPRLARQPLAGVIGDAFAHALLACSASAFITLALYLVVARSGRHDALLGALRTSSTAVWFAPATLLLAELSPLALGAALVLVISSTRMLYSEWRAIHPGQAAWIPPRELFEPPDSPVRLRDLAPALVSSFALEAGIVAVLIGDALPGAVLFSMAAAMLTLSTLLAGAYEPRTNRGLPRSILGLILTVILAVGFTVGGMAGHIQHGRGPRWPGASARHTGPLESIRAMLERLFHSDDAGQPKKSVTPIYAPPGQGNVEISDKSFPGIVLWTEPKLQTKLVAPRPRRSLSPLPSMPVEPSIIPFSGEYWMFRPPDTQPPRKSYSRWGNPLTLSFLTTDHANMTMEAHQRLAHAIDLTCCGEIQIAISNADRYPGTVDLELILIDDGSSQSLGTVAVPTRPEAILSFPVPANSAIHQFNEVKVVFHRDQLRIDRSARISIQRFILAPKS